MGPNINDKIPH